jgi:lipoprotein NlpD
LTQVIAVPPIIVPAPSLPTPSDYTVVAGDTLTRIGIKTGRDWKSIAEVNGIRDPYAIYVGQQLKLPLP